MGKMLTVSVLIAGFIIGFVLAPKSRTLTKLPIPSAGGEIAYSGPMILPQITNKPVLGAETISTMDFVKDINDERAKVGSVPLVMNTTLMKAAQMRVAVIKKYQNFSHQDPYEHIELGTVLPMLNYHCIYAAENIGMGGLSASDFVNGFMHSTHHREALQDPRYTETGVAFADGPYGQYYVNYAVQIFAIPSGTDEYLGYTTAEKTQYEANLAAVTSNLSPLIWFVERVRGNPRYSDAYYKNLTRQKQILESVVPLMQKSRPLTNSDVALIIEYNSLVSS